MTGKAAWTHYTQFKNTYKQKADNMKVLISTSSFARYDQTPLKILDTNIIDYTLNPYGRTLKYEEILELAKDHDAIIAGTEQLTRDVLEQLPELKMISRCGVGMDNVDMVACIDHGIQLKNTPDAVTPAVAELTLGLMLNISRHICLMNNNMKAGEWNKKMGKLISGKKIGIIGLGRIGKKLAQLLRPFDVDILAYDIYQDTKWAMENDVMYADMGSLLEQSDIISLHVPYSKENYHLLDADKLAMMKKGAYIINVARGGLIDEDALFCKMKDGYFSGAALDVFEKEPYNGKLTELENVILTPHVGSYAMEARIQMEIEATNNLIDMIGENI
ncbi:phosphoglycerate dehydrogenase [Methanolobus sp. ZRKC1]|uniref:phosphoglycerate dehydrogenase n=2 Tax=unclassified Methanolobus TaxID=2629569 RepID=UPI00324A444D